ncbi:hypothetical protein SPHINGOAX6_70824 [Sphingomonas sp. AX6]|nr:hypothetical protein SPHINGOAX6_70824 [Sphingomonas sp. AX6]
MPEPSMSNRWAGATHGWIPERTTACSKPESSSARFRTDRAFRLPAWKKLRSTKGLSPPAKRSNTAKGSVRPLMVGLSSARLWNVIWRVLCDRSHTIEQPDTFDCFLPFEIDSARDAFLTGTIGWLVVPLSSFQALGAGKLAIFQASKPIHRSSPRSNFCVLKRVGRWYSVRIGGRA